jgi:hypothetical protein
VLFGVVLVDAIIAKKASLAPGILLDSAYDNEILQKMSGNLSTLLTFSAKNKQEDIMNESNAWDGGSLILFVALAVFVVMMVLSVWQPIENSLHQLALVLDTSQ